MKLHLYGVAIGIAAVLSGTAGRAETHIVVSTPMTPPAWALLEREVFRAGSDASVMFFNKYFDERGYLEHVARQGTLDGCDDAIETFNNWTLFHAMGADNRVLDMYRKMLEGHFKQYTECTTKTTDIGKNGIYYKEFYRHWDGLHTIEGLRSFFFQGLTDPHDPVYVTRMRRFSGFYMNEDPDAPNYDPEHKIIRSTLTGSNGPLLRKVTAVDYVGDPTPGKFNLLHDTKGRGNKEMLDFEAEYPTMLKWIDDDGWWITDGDTPLNLPYTHLATCAFMLTGEAKYRDWVLEYLDAWKERIIANGGNIPGNIGLDGTIGGAHGGKWYPGYLMWNTRYTLFTWPMWSSFGNAYLLTGNASYIDLLRRQIDNLYEAGKTIDGTFTIPHHYGDDGWYGFSKDLCINELIKLYLWSLDPKDLERISKDRWVSFLLGNNPTFPEEVLARELSYIRNNVERIRTDITTPDTRLADWAQQNNPVTTTQLVQLMTGGQRVDEGMDRLFGILHCQVRYFDPENRRAGIPQDVAALVTAIDRTATHVTLVNVNQIEPREVVVQTGAYGEHQCVKVVVGDTEYPVDSRYFSVLLKPGAGAELVISSNRFANMPTMAFPWEGNTVSSQ